MQREGELRSVLRALTGAPSDDGVRGGWQKALRALHADWLAAEGVQGFGLAQRRTAGQPLRCLAIKVYVVTKKPRRLLRAPAPSQLRIPEIGPVPIDVEEIGRVEPQACYERLRPAAPGCSIGARNGVGSMACVVIDRENRERRYILSNAHVLVDLGFGKEGDEVLQPGAPDGGRGPDDVIGRVSRWIPIEYSSDGFPNLADVALGSIADTAAVSDIVRILGRAPCGASAKVERGMTVQKVGRQTDHTTGIVEDVDCVIALRYRRPGMERRAGFHGQVLCSSFTQTGDSGAAVLDMQHRVVGVHMAGSASKSVFNPIAPVLSHLGIEIPGEGPTKPQQDHG